MEIVQSAEDTGGIVGSPAQYKGAGTASLTACSMKEVIANSVHGSLWCLFSLQGKRQRHQNCPQLLPSPQHLLHSKPINLIQNLDLHKDLTAVSSSFSWFFPPTLYKLNAIQLENVFSELRNGNYCFVKAGKHLKEDTGHIWLQQISKSRSPQQREPCTF